MLQVVFNEIDALFLQLNQKVNTNGHLITHFEREIVPIKSLLKVMSLIFICVTI